MNDTDTPYSPSKVNIIAACFISAVSAGMVFNAFPVFLGAAADAYSLNDTQIGFLASAYIAGFAISSIIGAFLLRRVSWRRHGRLMLAITAVAFFLMSSLNNYTIAMVLLFILGLCLAQTFAMVMCFFGDLPQVDRLFALKVFSELLLAAVLLFILPAYILPMGGFTALLIFYVGLTLLALAALNFLPERALSREEFHSQSLGVVPVWAWVAIFMLMINFGAYAGIMVFLERIGADAEFSATQIGTALSVSLLVGVVAALSAAFSSAKIKRGPVFILACLVAFIAFAMLFGNTELWRFVLALCLFNLAWNFALPFQMGLVDEVDSSGKLITGLGAALAFGAVAGPPIVGIMRESGAENSVYIIAGIAIAFSTLGFLLIGKMAPGSGSLRQGDA